MTGLPSFSWMVSVPLPFFSSLPILTVISSTVTPVTAPSTQTDEIPLNGKTRATSAFLFATSISASLPPTVTVTFSVATVARSSQLPFPPGQQELGGGLDVTAAVRERRGEEQHPADNAHRDRRSHGLAFSFLPERERRVHTM
jgi:hypothetical protein